MNALVTGGSGFIGSVVVARLLTRGDRVTVLRRARREPLFVDRLARLSAPQLTIVTGDVTDSRALAQACRGADVVYHLAFIYKRAWHVGEDLLGPNLEATARVLEAAAAAGVTRIVLSGSVSVYGWSHPPWRWPFDESTPLRGWGTYAETKIRTESLVRTQCRAYGMRPALLRLPHVYGPGAITFERFIERLLHGGWLRRPRGERDPTLEWGTVWHLVHVRDAADAIVAAGTVEDLASDAFNIAGDTAVTRATLRRLVHQLASDHGERRRPPPAVPRFWMYDIRRARRELGFAPRVRLIDGVREVVSRLRGSSAAA